MRPGSWTIRDSGLDKTSWPGGSPTDHQREGGEGELDREVAQLKGPVLAGGVIAAAADVPRVVRGFSRAGPPSRRSERAHDPAGDQEQDEKADQGGADSRQCAPQVSADR